MTILTPIFLSLSAACTAWDEHEDISMPIAIGLYLAGIVSVLALY